MNWKISRIEIASFKAFKKLSLNVDSASLLTLDGPNGFGKTSIFDALELLFTGKIERVKRLFSKIMVLNQLHYQDNLYWNIRSINHDLYIKVEFTCNEEKLVLARHARANARRTDTNRADKFSQFSLYQLEDFSSSNFSENNARDESFIEEVFGENFQANYSFLNYLEQGQNEYLFSTKVDRRKDELEGLINTSAINSVISRCKEVERGLTQKAKTHETKEQELVRTSDSLRTLLEIGLEGVEYKQLSTSDTQPGWDKEELFPSYSKEIHDAYLNELFNLSELIPLKQAIKIRVENDKIESYIAHNNELLKVVAQLGKTIGKLNELDTTKNALDLLNSAKSILLKGAMTIKLSELESIQDWDPREFRGLDDQIRMRDELIKITTSSTAASAEIERLKERLIAEHQKLVKDDKDCPLCGADWGSHQALLDAIEERALSIQSSLNSDGKKLLETSNTIAKAIEILAERNGDYLSKASAAYDSELHSVLTKHKEKISKIQELIIRLEANDYIVQDTYSVDPTEIERRLATLITTIRSKKKQELASLPEHWRVTLNNAFKSESDFYLLETNEIDRKIKYISLKANESKSKELNKCILELNNIRKVRMATTTAKEKITKLKNELIRIEKSYSDQTISEIELIFHIYSGRLIQNYQRGLGLFIESRDGKQLRFSTAESSGHDAILSMSSGQISALSLAFFFSLNKVYSRVPIVMIDDPSQSLDEINIASLTDLLRCELNDRQLIVSSHEEEISSYMRYRFARAGLATLTLNMQTIAKEVS